MRTRRFGTTGIEVGILGFGPMPLSLEGRPTDEESLQLLQHVLAQGVTFFDTADTYGLGPHDLHHNERLLHRALATAERSRGPFLVGTKGGTVRSAEGWEIDGSPERIERAILESFDALGGELPIPLWQHHWPDPRFSISQMLKPVQRAVDQGLVRYVGVSNYSLDQIIEARDVVEIVCVQNQFNLWHREPERDGVLEYCERNELVFLPWRPLGGKGLANRLMEIDVLRDLSRERGFSPQRIMIAWHRARSPSILPILGSTQVAHVDDYLAAQDVTLEPAEVRRISAATSHELPRRNRAAAWQQRPPLARLDD